MKRLLGFLFFFFVVLGDNFAQMSISFPMENAVFQRNSANQATIYIAGSFTSTQSIDYIEAKLTPVNGGTTVNWTTITTYSTHLQGTYYGSLMATAGWYTLDVRSRKGTNVVETATIARVGVGEVFIIAGQSNAQGILNYGSVDANDERVINHNYDGLFDNDPNLSSTNTCSVKNPPFPSLSKIVASSLISKYGQSSWSYGKLGDLVSSRLGMPVAFYSAGASGSSSKNWYESAQGLATIHSVTGQTYCMVAGSPYSALRICLNYYASLFGVRAIFWHQGETDTSDGTTNTTYTNNINYVINKSRTDFGYTVPWIISRVSYNQGATSSEVILGQNNLVNSSNKVFAGPSTDGILPRVRDNLHFSDQSLIDYASAIDASLNSNFFTNATPISAQGLPQATATCNGNGTVTLNAPAGYSSYKWVVGNGSSEDAAVSTSQNMIQSSGVYRCWVKAGNNYIVTQAIDAANALTSCTSNPTSCSAVTYVSDLMSSGTDINGYGVIQYDKSNGGATLTLNGTTYSKGLGVHANSQTVYNLNGLYGRFITDIGIDDEINASSCSGAGGTVIFQVYKDNVLAYQSPILNRNSSIVKINLNVAGTNQLKLIVNDSGDGYSCDHADWAGARLHCIDNTAPTPPSNLVTSQIGTKCARLSWTGSTDNMEVQYYNIYVNNILTDSVAAPLTNYLFSNLTANTSYNVTVKARDYSGNISQFGATGTFSTISNGLVVNASKTLINNGQSINLTASGCTSGTVYWFNSQTGTSITYSPTVSGTYKAVCSTNSCISDSIGVAVRVLQPCQASIIINSLLANYSNFIVSAAQTIIADSIITSSSITYQAGNSVTLLPGFKADNSNVFVAKIQSCCNVSAPVISVQSSTTCNSTLIATGCAGTVTWSNAQTGSSLVVSSNSNASYTATCMVGACTSALSNVISVPNLPVSWSNNDIGTPPVAGCTSYDGAGNLTLKGTGVVMSTSDQCHYVYKVLSSSNATIIAKIASQTSSSNSGMRSGIMIRSTNQATAPFFEVIVENKINNRVVAKAGRGAVMQNALLYGYSAVANTDVVWLKIDKVGNTLTASYSINGGVNWTVVTENVQAQPTISFGSTYYIGFNSYNDNYSTNSLVNQTTFSNITINGVAF